MPRATSKVDKLKKCLISAKILDLRWFPLIFEDFSCLVHPLIIVDCCTTSEDNNEKDFEMKLFYAETHC